MRTIVRAFTDHPATVNETYRQHLVASWSFGFRLLGAGLACVVHGVMPFLFTQTGSTTVRELHERMVANRVLRDPPTRPDGPA